MKFGVSKNNYVKPGKEEVVESARTETRVETRAEKPKTKTSIFSEMLSKAAATKSASKVEQVLPSGTTEIKWSKTVQDPSQKAVHERPLVATQDRARDRGDGAQDGAQERAREGMTTRVQDIPKTETRISDEPRSCPSSFAELDLAKKMRDLEGSVQDLDEFDIVGAELRIFDIENLAKNNEAPKITSGDSKTGSLKGSLNDPRMGVVENNAICETCGGDNIQCPGHFGYIKLNHPIYHPLFAPLIPKILSSICITCGTTYLSEEYMREKGIFNYHTEKRLNVLSEESCNQMCQRCQDTDVEMDGKRKKTKGCPGMHIVFIWNKDCKQIQAQLSDSVDVKGLQLEREAQTDKDKEKNRKPKGRTVPIGDVIKILKGMDEKTCSLLGFANGAHPKKFVIEYFPVLPPISRQPKFIDGKVIEDKLTEQYRTIISKNEAIATAKSDQKITATRALYDEIDKFIQGSDAGKKGDFKSIKGRLQGKDERIRGTMMGRRVNFSARTVLGPKPSLKFGQMALPKVWSKQLRIEEMVFDQNRQKLQDLLEDGKIHFIFPCDGKYKGLPVFVNDTWRTKYKLKIGDKVERELMTGDYTIFNRQPTLHKQSIMGYEVVLHDEFTLGMHISTTRPHNADKLIQCQQQEATIETVV
jgi:DNA-directed RNA polymerase II subunit RPB1